jgi:hypothetical protein
MQSVPCLIVPPLPCYLFVRFCGDPAHCTDWNCDGFPAELLPLQIKNFLVIESCFTTSCTTISNTATRISELRKVTAKDGVHFVEAGYKALAVSCVAGLRTLLCVLAKRDTKCTTQEAFFWHSVRSPVGSSFSAISHMGYRSAAQPSSHRGRGWSTTLRGQAWAAGRPFG